MGETLDTIGSGLALAGAVGAILVGTGYGVKYFGDHYRGMDAAYIKGVNRIDDLLPGDGLLEEWPDCEVDRYFDPDKREPGFVDPCTEAAGKAAIREGR